jgi:iron complex outermembrane receptor protein
VPISVTPITGSALEFNHIKDTLDVQFKVPNLYFSKTNFTGSNLQIRGIGSQVVAASGEPAVGVHVNEVPLTTSRIFEQEFFDIERLEVLRGPQGTLFGRNSTGGSFNIYTKKPTDEFEFKADVTGGNYATAKVNGAVNIPIGDRLRTRVAGMFLRRDGYIDNLGTGNDIDDRQLWGIRASLQADITDKLVMDAMVSYFREDDSRSRIGKQLCNKDSTPFNFSIGCGPGKQGFDSLNSTSTLGGIFDTIHIPGFIGLPLTPVGLDVSGVNPADLRTQDARIDPEYYADELFADLVLDYDVNVGNVTLLFGYQSTDVESTQDYNMGRPSALGIWDPNAVALLAGVPSMPGCTTSDGAAGVELGEFGCNSRSFAQDNSDAESEQISGEARFTSDFEGPFNFTTGAIYSYFTTYTDYKVFFSGAEILARLWQTVDAGYDVANLRHFNNESKPARTNSFGLYAEGYYEFLDTWQLTGGIRYTNDRKEAWSRNYLLNGLGNPATIGTDQLPGYEKQEESWNEVTGRVIVDKEFDFAFTDQSNAYLSYSRGYKPGGFNPPAAAQFPGTSDTFDPEFINAFEIGTKNQLFDSTLQANLGVFFYDYRDYQISKIVNRTSVNENIDAFVWGLEAEFIWAPVEGLLISSSIGYLGSQIRDGQSIDTADPSAGDPNWDTIKHLVNGSNLLCARTAQAPGSCASSAPPYADLSGALLPGYSAGIEKDLSGNELPNQPDVQFNIGGQYTYSFGRGGELTGRMSWYWQSEMYGRMFNTTRDEIDSWSQADAGLRWNDEQNLYFVEFWIKNFTDNDDITSQYFTDASSGNFTNVFLLEPRTLGITIGATF